MKKIAIFAAIAAAAVAVWYFFLRPKKPAGSSANVNLNSATAPATYLNMWANAAASATTAAGSAIKSTFDLFKTVSNAFGYNDGGNAGVSVSGSQHGGTASSGAGAAIPGSGSSVIPDSLYDLNFDDFAPSDYYA